MILKADAITDLLSSSETDDDPFVITPMPNLEELRKSGSASVDLRLGTWFLKLRQAKLPILKVLEDEDRIDVSQLYTKYTYVPFGDEFILHPRSFVLGATLEWLRINKKLAGIVTGKSSWGRRGLIIATATGIHPGFSGCLTLEITNLGEIPIQLKPGMPICQLFLHKTVDSDMPQATDSSQFNGRRRPILGKMKTDDFCKKLSAE